MTQPSLSTPNSGLRVFSASLLSALLIMMPFVQMAAASRRESGVGTKDGRRQTADSSQSTAAAAENIFVDPALPGPVAVPLAPAIVATKDDGLAAATTVAPGGTITYTVNIQNNGAASPADDALAVAFNDTIDAHTTLVGNSTVAAVSDRYNTIGNTQISVPDGSTDLLGNDVDPDPPASGTNTGMTVTGYGATTGIEQTVMGTATPTAQGGSVTVNGNGSFTYDPPLGFEGTDTFKYRAADVNGFTAITTVRISIAGMIWFINNNAGACTSSCDGRLSHPFQTLAAFQAVNNGTGSNPAAGDSIFLYESATAYVGPVTLLNTQKLIGQDATASLATITGLTAPSGTDPFPAMNTGAPATTITSASNGINLGQGNTLRGFTVGNTTGTKISGSSFGTLIVGNSVSPDVTLNGTGQALSLTTGTLSVTGGFVSVTTTSSTAQGINLVGVADSDGAGGGSFSFGSTTVSGSTTQGIFIGTTTADINFGNTAVGTGTASSGGTDAISFQNNSAGTRGFGTITIQNNSGVGFLHAGPGGAVTISGTTTITNPGGSGISITNSTTAFIFGDVNVTGSGGIGVTLTGNLAITFADLDISPDSGVAALVTNTTGTVTTTSGTIVTTSAAAVSPTSTPLAMVLTSVTANNVGGGGPGINLTTDSGTLTVGAGLLTGGASPAFAIVGGTVAVTYSGGMTQAGAGALTSITGGHGTGTITFNTGTLSATNGTGLQFDNADGTYNYNGTTTLNGGDAGIDILNGSAGTFNFLSTTITSPSGTAFNVATSPTNPTITYSGNITQNNAQRVVNIDGTTGNTITFQTGTITGGASSTGININNANGNVTFSNGMTLGTSGSRMTNQAVTIAGGSGAKSLGAVSIFTTGTAEGIHSTTTTGAITINSGEVNSAGAAAINIAGTSAATRTPLNIQLTALSANGGAKGLILLNTSATGSPGGFRVNGTGSTDGSGGTIQNTDTRGADIQTVDSLVLKNMNFTNANDTTDGGAGGACDDLTLTGCNSAIFMNGVTTLATLDNLNITGTMVENGITAISVANFKFDNSLIDGAGNEPNESGIEAQNLSGTSTVNNTEIRFSETDAFAVVNTSTPVNLTLSSSTFRDSQTVSSGGATNTNGEGGFQFRSFGTGTSTINILNSSFLRLRTQGIQVFSNDTSTINMDIVGNTIDAQSDIGTGIDINADDTSTLNFNITGNPTIQSRGGAAVNITSFLSGHIEGRVNNNPDIEVLGGPGIPVRVVAQETSHAVILIDNNTVTNVNGTEDTDIDVQSRFQTARADVTITRNTVTPEPTGIAGINLISGSSTVGESNITCGDIGGTSLGNNVTNAVGNGVRAFRVRNSDLSNANRLYLEGFTTDTATTWINRSNLPADAGEVAVSLTGTAVAPSAPPGGICEAVDTSTDFVFLVPDTQKSDPSGLFVASAAAESNRSNELQSVPSANVNPLTLARVATTVFTHSASDVHSVVSLAKDADTSEQRSDVSAHHAQVSKPETRNSESDEGTGPKAHDANLSKLATRNSNVATTSAAMAGETVTATIGTLPAGGSVTITFQVTVNPTPNLILLNPPRVSNQGTVSGSNFANVLTDDPTVGGGADPTETRIDLFDTTTTLASNLNPSNFGDNVTFTATVAENPVQGSADPTGTVDFIDTNNGNTVICNDVALTAGSAQCMTSALAAGTHDMQAVYSGDGNFDGSNSNIVNQVVNACTANPIVTSTADNGAGTLREALANVCGSPSNVVTFNIAGAGPHTITLTTGELAVAKSVVINNNSGERITVTNATGRAFNINAAKTATIIGLTITGNNAAGDGGAIVNDGALTIINSTLTGSTSGIDGGAISTTATGTALTLINTTISGNTAAGSGGGLITLGGTVTIINSTITNNTADSDNNAAGSGGGIRAHAGTVTLKNTIVAGNFNEDGATDAADDISGTVDAASSFNLIGDAATAGGLTNGVNNNQVGNAGTGTIVLSTVIGALADNGGLTNTHALVSSGPAVETGSNANLPVDTFDLDGDTNVAEALPVDQRGLGFPRNADSADANTTQTVDIGAFELHPSIENIPNDSTNEDTPKNVVFNLGDDTGSLISTVTATSSNTTLVPNNIANLSFTGSGGSRTLQITPAANQSGTTTITVTVTATNGRTAVDTFDLTVNAVNDAPAGTDNTVTTAEETAYTFAAADFGFTDPNDSPPNTLLAVKITTLPALGTLTNNNVAVNAGDSIPVADINGGLLKFTPAANGDGSPYTTFTFQVQDNGGGTDLDPTPNTMTINVTGVNDGPVNTVPGPQNTDEDVALVFSSGNGNQISVADVDGTTIQVTLTATNGTLTLSGIGGLSFSFSDANGTGAGDGTADATMTFRGSLANVNTALNGMSFTPTSNFSGAASVSISSNDLGNTGTGGPLTDGPDTVNITVNAVNDPPAGTDNTVTTAEDTAYTFTAADFGFTDPNDTPPNTLLAVKITTLPALGTLTNNNVAVNAGDSIPVADINGGLLKFTPVADGNGTPYTTFTFQVQDNGGGTDLDPTPNTMTINVTVVNDGPTNTVPGPQNTNEDVTLVFSSGNGNQISVADVDGTTIQVTLTATNGTLTLSGIGGLSFSFSDANGTGAGDGTADATMTFRGSLANVNTALNGMSFTPTADYTGSASVSITSNDLGNTGTGGPLTDGPDTVNITVNAQNDAPVVTAGGTLNYAEGDAATAIDTTITVSDADNANLASATAQITGNYVNGEDVLSFTNTATITGVFNSGSGTLTLTGSDTVANYQAALRAVKYNNTSENPSTSARTVSWIANDGSSPSSAVTSTVNVTSVNDAPVNTVPGPQGTNQNTPLTFSSGNGNQISVADVDAGASTIQVTLTVTNGTLTLSGTSGLSFSFSDANGTGAGDGTADATMTFRGTLTNVNNAMNGMTYTPTMGFSGAASLTITTNDLGNTGSGGPLSDTDVVNIQVSTNMNVQDAQVAEPPSGTTNMLFTVTLSAPAPAGGASVNYTTANGGGNPATGGAACGGSVDYITTAGSLTFSAGQQVKTIAVPVCADTNNAETNETFFMNLSGATNATLVNAQGIGTITTTNQPGTLLISELRTSGPGGAGDDFVEIYNNTGAPHTVNGTGGGYGVFKMGATCDETPILIGVIPNGTVIPAGGHFLFTGSAYSLADYGGTGAAAGDATLSSDIENDRNVAFFSTASVANISSANRFDAVGFGTNTGTNCDLLREGATLLPVSGSVVEYSYFRKMCEWIQNQGCTVPGIPKDTNDNSADFWLADTAATAFPSGIIGVPPSQRLGAPGPENLGSPVRRDTGSLIGFALLDGTVGSSAQPNRERNSTPVTNGAFGTMTLRYRVTNNTVAPVTRLRYRIVDVSTAPAPPGQADLRALTSSLEPAVGPVGDSVTCATNPPPPSNQTPPCTVAVTATTLEQPPTQASGGGYNSTLSSGSVTLGSPLAPGASLLINFKLGVQQTGTFRFYIIIEALP